MAKYKIDVLILIEHVDREMLVSKLLKKELERKGLTVIIGSILFHLPELLLKYTPKAILTPYIGFGKTSPSTLFYHLYGNSIRYFNINYEQILFPFTGSFKAPKTKQAKENQINFCWGPNFRNFLLANGVLEKNIFISGRPYSSAVISMNEKRDSIRVIHSEKNSLNLNKKWIFIALTDSLAMSELKYAERAVKKDGDIKALHQQIEWDKKTIFKLLKILVEIDKDPFFKDYEIILRPHPTIGKEDYIMLFEKLSIPIPRKLKIIKNSDAISWLIASDYYITNYSTLIADALAINKPVFTINSNKTENTDYLWLVEHANSKFATLTEFKGLFEKESVKNNSFISEDWISKKDAIIEISDVINLKIKDLNFSKPNYFNKKMVFTCLKFIKHKFISFWIEKIQSKINLIKESKLADYYKMER
jgi:surface carbohydrate biosynthesis protein